MCDLEHVESLIDSRSDLLETLGQMEYSHIADIVVNRVACVLADMAGGDEEAARAMADMSEGERWDGLS